MLEDAFFLVNTSLKTHNSGQPRKVCVNWTNKIYEDSVNLLETPNQGEYFIPAGCVWKLTKFYCYKSTSYISINIVKKYNKGMFRNRKDYGTINMTGTEFGFDKPFYKLDDAELKLIAKNKDIFLMQNFDFLP